MLPEYTPGEKGSDSWVTFTPSVEDDSQYTDLHLLENVGVREDSLVGCLAAAFLAGLSYNFY